MRSNRRLGIAALVLGVPATIALSGCGAGGASKATAASDTPVKFSQVQQVFNTHCTSCHPSVNGALNLTAGKSYKALVGAGAVEAPGQVRVVAGDPKRSFLLTKIAGDPSLGDIPPIGTRMPPGQPAIPAAEIELVRNWIAQGAKNDAGATVSANRVPVDASIPTFTGAAKAVVETGTGTVTGKIVDQRGKPIAGAVVTLLLKGAEFPDGEEHVRAELTDAAGRYSMPKAPLGRIELKAYAPQHLYVARIFEVADGQTVNADFGLPDRQIPNPVVSAPRVQRIGAGTRLSMIQKGFSLDRNYSVAVNVAAHKVFELRAPKNETREGKWVRNLPTPYKGRWIFFATDETCNTSEFMVVGGASPSPRR